MAKRIKGKFITFEGAEGCGKSTQANLLCQYLKKQKQQVLHLREPGGLLIGEKIRKILLDVKNRRMTRECEILLYMAARAQLVEEIIFPALKKGVIVVCDRFLDSTVAYQGYGCGISIDFIQSVGKFITKGLAPDLTFLLDMEVKKGFSRKTQPKDRIEQRSIKYHDRVRQGYLDIARKNKSRFKIINAHQAREEIQDQIKGYIQSLLNI